MPKKKFEDTPYDPIAADLAREVGAAGRTAPRPLAPLPTPMTVPTPLTHLAESTITKRFVLTRGENEEVNAFLLRLEQRAKTKATLSVFMRAALTVAMQAEEQIVAELGGGLPLAFPSTHDPIAQGEFEDRWTRCLANALRRLPRWDGRDARG